jgi:hypothetical protein
VNCRRWDLNPRLREGTGFKSDKRAFIDYRGLPSGAGFHMENRAFLPMAGVARIVRERPSMETLGKHYLAGRLFARRRSGA